MGHFYENGQNLVVKMTSQVKNLGKVVKKNCVKNFGKYFQVGHYGGILLKYAFLGVFPTLLHLINATFN